MKKKVFTLKDLSKIPNEQHRAERWAGGRVELLKKHRKPKHKNKERESWT